MNMSACPKALELTATSFACLRDLIHERLGLYFDEGKRTVVAAKLLPLVVDRGLSSFLDYYRLLQSAPEADGEWLRVINQLAIQETYFWREIEQIRTALEILLPACLASGAQLPLRIWSAACSSGEEPLTIAIALEESRSFEPGSIEIHASDASSMAIDRARQGLYRDRSLRLVPPDVRARYFSSEGEFWRVAPRIHGRINWHLANLLAEDEIRNLAAAHIIFCRNVFSYFSAKNVFETVRIFYRLMASPGFLFVGTSESLTAMNTGFRLQEMGKAFVYTKP